VNDLPDGLDVAKLPRVLAEGWGFDVAAIEYAPVGFGSYHWVATDETGAGRFVTVDDLDRKPWFGDGRDAALDGMARSFETAVALQEAGLEFVLAPIRSSGGRPVLRLDDRHSIAVFPFVDGVSRDFGAHETPERRSTVLGILAKLHLATSAVASTVPKRSLDLPGRSQLEAGLGAVDQPWTGGPYSERARHALGTQRSGVTDALERFDRLRQEIEGRSTDWVVTHGEPHAANVIWVDGAPQLIDWDTVALAPPERDLWMVLDGSEHEAAAYAASTGHQPDPIALEFYGLTWDLADVAQYVDVLRAPHGDIDDIRTSHQNLLKDLAAVARWVQAPI
jgi:spectinomycin phosphotransferase